MNITIRLETKNDYKAVEELTREAFWGINHPACDEHYLVHVLRNSDAFIKELDFVACIDEKIVGNVMFSKAKVIGEDKIEHLVLTFGPLSVLPDYKSKGVGSRLLKHAILEAKRLGYAGIVFHGHPDYYPRFGFVNAKIFGITNSNGANYDSLMAMELYEGALKGISGKFYEDSLFEVDENKAEEYDKNFPKKEKVTMLPIDVLLEKLPQSAKKAFKEHNIQTIDYINRLSGRELLCWDGIDENVLAIINQVLNEYNYSRKLFPNDKILEKAKMGIKILEENI